VLLAALVALALAPVALAGGGNVVQGDGIDNLDDSGPAPDLGIMQASVGEGTDYRRLTVGTWLDHSDLTEGERISWLIDVSSGTGEEPYGGDYLVFIRGYDDRSDQWSTWRWDGTEWVGQVFGDFALRSFADGRIYWQFNISPSGSTPDDPTYIGLRVLARRSQADGNYVDRLPDSTLPNMLISLEPHGSPDPLAGCKYTGSCVGGASGVGVLGPEANSGQCASTRAALADVRSRLSSARIDRIGTSGRRRARLTRKVRRLQRKRDSLQSLVGARC
jgi:hypothetical protein